MCLHEKNKAKKYIRQELGLGWAGVRGLFLRSGEISPKQYVLLGTLDAYRLLQ